MFQSVHNSQNTATSVTFCTSAMAAAWIVFVLSRMTRIGIANNLWVTFSFQKMRRRDEHGGKTAAPAKGVVLQRAVILCL
jgi:hypothetical protein